MQGKKGGAMKWSWVSFMIVFSTTTLAGAAEQNKVMVETILAELTEKFPEMRVEVRADSEEERQEILGRPVNRESIAYDTGQSALTAVAEQADLHLCMVEEPETLKVLEKITKITIDFSDRRLGEIAWKIAHAGGAWLIFSPKVDTNQRVDFHAENIHWREALDSFLKEYSYAVMSDRGGVILGIATPDEVEIKMITYSRPLRYIQLDGYHFRPDVVDNDNPCAYTEARLRAQYGPGKHSLPTILFRVKSERGIVTYESRTNTLILYDSPAKIEEMLELIDLADRPLADLQ